MAARHAPDNRLNPAVTPGLDRWSPRIAISGQNSAYGLLVFYKAASTQAAFLYHVSGLWPLAPIYRLRLSPFRLPGGEVSIERKLKFSSVSAHISPKAEFMRQGLHPIPSPASPNKKRRQSAVFCILYLNSFPCGARRSSGDVCRQGKHREPWCLPPCDRSCGIPKL